MGKKTGFRCVPSGLVPSSKIPAGLQGPHCLECQPANQFLPSKQKRKKGKVSNGRPLEYTPSQREKRRIEEKEKVACLLRMRCDHFLHGSPTPASRRCF